MHEDVSLTQTISLQGLGLALQRMADQMDDIASRLARIEQRQLLMERAINPNPVNNNTTTEATMSDPTGPDTPQPTPDPEPTPEPGA
jgi:hypothetical protein